MTSKYTRIEQIILPAVESFSCRLYGLELIQGGKRQVLRVLLEGPKGDITIAEVSSVSRQISRVLDVADVMRGGYVLEVSSPGLDKPLLKPAHFEAAVGENITVSLSMAVEQRKKFNGKLISVTEDTLVLQEDEQTHRLPLSDVQKARVVPEIKVGRGQKS